VSVWDRVFEQLFPERRWESPGQLALAADHRTVQTPALDLIDSELVRWFDEPESRLIITMPPQEGKSERCSKYLPVWGLEARPEEKWVLASYAHSLARRNGRAARDLIKNNPELFVHTVREDMSAQHEWGLEGHRGSVYAVGVGGGLTGQPADCIVIDDPVKDREQADSEVYREKVWDWWQDVVTARLSAEGRVLVIMTRWHEDDLVGRLLARDDRSWRVLNVPAQCTDEATDPLGRPAGEFMLSARRRTQRQWRKRKASLSTRSWESLYQGAPTPGEGTVFLRKFVQYYDRPVWTINARGEHLVPGSVRLLQSWDMAFKDKKDSDFVVGQVWARIGPDFYLLDQVRGRMSFTASCAAVQAMTSKWPQALTKLVEDKANGTAVIDHLKRLIPGLIAVEPRGGKLSRAEAVSPFWEAGNVKLPRFADWTEKYVSEMASFPNGANDDQVDGTTQALNRMGVRRTTSRSQKLW
jgi:predicted phage terminase large subunit-like protein